MDKRALIAGWFDPETKARFTAVARSQGLSESSLLKHLVNTVLLGSGAAVAPVEEPPAPDKTSARISIRVREADFLRLRDRARSRHMPTSTYVTYLLEAHLNADPPLPTAEFQLLRQSLLAVSAIGRNLNQIARALNAGNRSAAPPDFRALIQAVRQLRLEFRTLLGANRNSWRTSRDQAGD